MCSTMIDLPDVSKPVGNPKKRNPVEIFRTRSKGENENYGVWCIISTYQIIKYSENEKDNIRLGSIAYGYALGPESCREVEKISQPSRKHRSLQCGTRAVFTAEKNG